MSPPTPRMIAPSGVHGHVAARGRQGAAVPGGQPARIRVAALDRVGRGAVVLDQGGDERALVARVAGIVAVAAAEQAVFQVRLHPRARSVARGEPAQGAEVDRVHVTVAVVAVVGLGVAVVEAAAAVDVGAAGHHVGALRLGSGRHSRGGIVAVPGSRAHEDPVDLMAPGHDRQRGRVRADVRPSGPAGWPDREVVVLRGLVEDLGDGARGARAERVLRRRVGVASRGERPDVRGGAVRRAPDLVQRAVVGRVQGPRGAVRGHARRAGRGVDVAREGRRRSGRGRAAGDQGSGDECRRPA